MDWFSWLSRSSLEPSLIYEYGLAFARNELQEEDLTYFNHEFLQSMGISVAKHRLEILKLANKEAGVGARLSKLKTAIRKTKNSIKKRISKLVFHDQESAFKALPEPVRYKEQWRGGLTRKCRSDKELFQVEKLQPPVIRTRIQAKSGPLDGRMPENFMQNPRILKLSGPLDGRVPEHLLLNDNRNLKLSGPLDGKVHDRLVFAYRSPKLSGNSEGRLQQKFTDDGKSPKVPRPLEGDKGRIMADDFDDQSLWSALFQDMKPT